MFLDRICEHTFISNILSPSSLVVDLGMNNGNFSYEIQRKYGCKIIGVEPNPVLCNKIVKSERLRCFNYAITNEVGEVDFHIDENDSESSSIFLKTGTGIKVPSTSLASFIKNLCIAEIDLLKIDIEGAELMLFQETAPIVFTKIKQISTEFHGFIWPDQIPTIKKIICSMRAANFYVIDFSIDFSNVLFINQNMIPLRSMIRAWIVFHKYKSGLARMYQGDTRVR